MKANPYKTCKCQACRTGNKKSYEYRVAKRKFRHQGRLELATVVGAIDCELDGLDENLSLGFVGTRYTD